uniref:Ig-like domain-containing protein n=1 Tax=Anas zonorhyncha TaxID=75864 RepID=A0A8B9VIK2_9AVES
MFHKPWCLIEEHFIFIIFLLFFLLAGEAPAIRKEMQDVTTKLGEAAQLTCQIVGRPLPDIKWYRFGKELLQSRKYKMSSDGRNHTLTVITDEQEDEGLYTSVQEVIKKSIVTEDVKELKAEIRASSTQMTVSEGQKVTLKASIPGACEVKWVLNGMELRNSDDYRYGVSGSDHTLTIKKASNKDEGILTCEGKTDEGIIKCQYVLTFSKERSNEPAFIMQPKSQNVNEGQDVLFTCEVSGDPSPEIEWFKNNQPVSILTRSKNIYSLQIQNAAVSDTGKYTVKAKNYHGQCSATASLTVLRKFVLWVLCSA